MESDHKVSFRELAVQVDQFIVGSFIPVLGWTPQFPEILLNLLGLVEGEVLVNSTPCAVQSACNPTIDKVWIRSVPKGFTVIHIRMTSTGRLPSKEELARCGRLDYFTVDITAFIYTRTKERISA